MIKASSTGRFIGMTFNGASVEATVLGKRSGRAIEPGAEVTEEDGDFDVTWAWCPQEPDAARRIVDRARAFKVENDAGLLGHVPPAVKVSL